MSNDRPTTEELAFQRLANLREPTELERRVMEEKFLRDIVADARRSNPNKTVPPENHRPAGAPQVVDAPQSVNGWQKEAPLRSPPGQDIIERLADTFAPHGPGSPLRKKEG